MRHIEYDAIQMHIFVYAFMDFDLLSTSIGAHFALLQYVYYFLSLLSPPGSMCKNL